MQIDRQKYLNEWDPEFRAQSAAYSRGPVQQRPCRDVCCLVFFFLIVASFIWFGVSFFGRHPQPGPVFSGINTTPNGTLIASPSADPFSQFEWKPILTVLLLMAVLSIMLSALYLFLMKTFPRCMIYTTMAITLLLLLGLAITCFLFGQIIPGILLLVLLAIFSCCFWCCLRNSLDAIVLVLRLSANFLENNLSIFLIPVVITFFGLILLSFGLAWSLQAVAAVPNHHPNQQMYAIGFPALCYYLFFSFFLYYIIVFLIASAVGQWYYQRSTGCCAGLGNLFRGHIGSLTFASVLITLIKLIQIALDTAQKESDNCTVKIVLCCVQCCFSMIEGLLQTLNHYAVIVMSYTGQGFVDAAKTGGVVIFSHPELFATLSSASGFLTISGVLFLTITPTTISVFLCKAMGMTEAAPVVATFTFFIGLIIACFFLCTLGETISSMFVFYCFDRQLQIYGVRELPMPVGHPYSYEQLVNQNLSAEPPVSVLSAAYPYVSRQVPSDGISPAPAASNPYQPVVAAEPAQTFPSVPGQPLYQPYNSGINTNYQQRNYNAENYQPQSGIRPDYQNRGYNDPARFSSTNPSGIGRPAPAGYPQL